MRDIEFRNFEFKAVMCSEYLKKYYVSDACYSDGGATMLEYLFSFENRNIDEMWGDLFSSESYIAKFQNIISEDEMDDYALLDWAHIGNIQYTGLKDKNGVEIYEGDIVKYFDETFEIVYHTITASFILKTHSQDDDWSLGGEGWKKVEVIGNIYENPELLGKADVHDA